MKIKSLHLRHVYHFADLKLQLQPAEQPIALILGAQASGKTAILKNIYQALTWFAARFKDLRTAGVVMLDQDIMHNRLQSKVEITVKIPNELGTLTEMSDAHSSDQSLCTWQMYKTLNVNGVGISRVESEQLEQLVVLYLKAIQQDPLQGLPLIAYYPTERFINEVNLLSKNNPAVMQTAAAYEITAIPFTTFGRFFEWFREISDIENAQSAQLFQQILKDSTQLNQQQDPDKLNLDFQNALFQARSHLHSPSLQALKSSLTTVIPELTDIFIEYKPKLQLMVKYNHKIQSFQQLSSSTKNWIALVGDVVRRLCLLNPLSLYPCLEGDGILLIDHVDIELDQEHAQMILQRLHQAFPEIQIIATTVNEYMLEASDNMQCFKLNQQNIHEIQLDDYHADLEQLYVSLQQESSEHADTETVNEPISTVEQLFQQIQHMSDSEQQQLRVLLQIDDDRSSQKTLF